MSYATVASDIAAWIGRSDLTSVIPTFVSFAEAKFNERIRHSAMEAAFAEVALVSGKTALPADFKEFKYLVNTASNPYTLNNEPLNWIKSRPVDASTPAHYAVDNDYVVCWPTSGSISGVYLQTIPGLQANTTNWLDTLRHDLYVYESLSHAYLYLKDQQSALLYSAQSDAIIAELNAMDKKAQKSGSPLVIRGA